MLLKGGIWMKLRCFVFILLFTLFCFNACAGTVTFDSATDLLHVEYDQCLPGELYAFICVTGNGETFSLADDNVYYLHQLKADVNGCIRAAIVGQINKQYSFWLGGNFAAQASPVKIGSFNASQQHLPAALTVIDEEAFMGTRFQLLYLEDGISMIGARAFMNCADLNFICIPQSVKSIGEDAFSGCPNVVICCEEGSAAYQYALDRGLTIELHQGGVDK